MPDRQWAASQLRSIASSTYDSTYSTALPFPDNPGDDSGGGGSDDNDDVP